VKSFDFRGVVEGFYGKAYSHEDRLWLIERMGRWGMNLYFLAPKDDPLGRADWRRPYGDEVLSQFAELAAAGRRGAVRVGFTLSPGLSIEYSSEEDRAALKRKFSAFAACGADAFCLALDDVSSDFVHAHDRERFDSLAAAHVDLAHELKKILPPEALLWLVPTDYAGVESSPYLDELGANLAPDIEVGWSGRTILSPTIRASEAEARASVLRRRLLIWDNFPVSDGPMRPMLHLGPYLGRDADLGEHASGVLLNPMERAHASAPALQTAAEYLNDPQAYSADRAWQSATAEAGVGAADAFALFASAHCFSTLRPEARDPVLEAAFDLLRGRYDDGLSADEALSAAAALLEERVQAAASLRNGLEDRTLLVEIEPWLRSHETESQRMLAAVELLQALEVSSGGLERVLAFSRFEGRLTQLPIPAVSSYGPRRVLYPQLASLGDEDACFGSDPALFVDCCLSDEVVRLAERRTLERLSPD